MSEIKPPEQRRNRHKPITEVQSTATTGWQHGRKPAPPRGLQDESRETWRAWCASLAAAFWYPGDLPGLRVAIRLYDRQLTEPTASNAVALARYMDAYGLTPAGLQRRRWRGSTDTATPTPRPTADASRYRKLKVVGWSSISPSSAAPSPAPGWPCVPRPSAMPSGSRRATSSTPPTTTMPGSTSSAGASSPAG